MKVVFSLLLLSAVSFTSCSHFSNEGRHHAAKSCCKDSKEKDCKDGSCKLKKGEKKKSCCSKK